MTQNCKVIEMSKLSEKEENEADWKFHIGRMFECQAGGYNHEHKDKWRVYRCQFDRELSRRQMEQENEKFKAQEEQRNTEEAAGPENLELQIQIEKRKTEEAKIEQKKLDLKLRKVEVMKEVEKRKYEEAREKAEIARARAEEAKAKTEQKNAQSPNTMHDMSSRGTRDNSSRRPGIDISDDGDVDSQTGNADEVPSADNRYTFE